eukprot:7182973-Prymnesium_polylepis.1
MGPERTTRTARTQEGGAVLRRCLSQQRLGNTFCMMWSQPARQTPERRIRRGVGVVLVTTSPPT